MNLTKELSPEHSLYLNIVPSLVELKEHIASAMSTQIPYSKLFGLFKKYASTYKNWPQKDVLAFNLSQCRLCKKEEYLCELYKKHVDKPHQTQSISTDGKRKAKADTVFMGVGDNRFVVLRRKTSIRSVGSVLFDFDNSDPTHIIAPCQVLKLLVDLGCDFIAYSTYSTTSEIPKFRVIIPLNEYIDPKYLQKVITMLLGIFDPTYAGIIRGSIDITSFQPIRYFYLPASKGEYQIEKMKDEIPSVDYTKSWIVYRHRNIGIDVDQCCMAYAIRDPSKVLTFAELDSKHKEFEKLKKSKQK